MIFGGFIYSVGFGTAPKCKNPVNTFASQIILLLVIREHSSQRMFLYLEAVPKSTEGINPSKLIQSQQ